MLRLHRFILLCLLAVAIPFQGFAAATMTHGDAGTVDAAMSVEDMQSMGDMADMDMSMDMTLHDHRNAEGPAQDHAHKGSCSACAACCAVAALGCVYALSFASVPVEALAMPTLRPRVAFLTSGPERPPRSALA